MGVGQGEAHIVLCGCEVVSLILADVADLYAHVHSAQGGGLLRAGVSHKLNRGRPRMIEWSLGLENTFGTFKYTTC